MERDDIPNPYEAPRTAVEAECRWFVRIIATPPGEAPEPIRQAWVGLVLPLSPRWQGRREFRGLGVLSGPRGRLGARLALLAGRSSRQTGYAVEGRDAVDALAKHAAAAAEWWRSNVAYVLEPGRMLVFAAEACELVLPPGESAPLNFRGRLTEDDLVAIQWCVDRLAIGRPFRWLACGLATLVSALCLAAIAARWRTIPDLPRPVLVSVLAAWFVWLYLLFHLPRQRAWRARRHYRLRAEKYLESQVVLSSDRVTIENDALRTEMRWDLLGRIIDVPAGLLFCSTSRQVLFWLPDRVFDEARSRERVLALARGHGVLVQRRV